MSSDVRKNYIYNIIYRLSICILPLVVTPYAARVLGVAGNGIYAFSSTVACYFIMFGKLGLDNYGNRSIAFCRDDMEQRSRTFWGIYTFQLCTSALSLLLYVAGFHLFFHDHRLIYWMQFLYVASALFDVSWFFYGMEKFRLATIRSLISRTLLIAGVFLFVSSEQDLWVFTLVMSFSFLLEQLMLFPFVFKHVKFVRITYRDIIRHIKPNLKLFVPLLALSVYNWMNKIMLGILDSTDSVAYYSYAESIINLPQGIIAALGTVMLPKLAYMAANNQIEACKESLRRSMVFICFISCALCFGIAGVAPVFVPWFFGPAFSQTIALTIGLAIIMLPKSAGQVVQMQYLIPFQLDHIYIQSVSLGAGVNLILNLLLIPPLKITGAIVATISAELAVCVYQMIRIRGAYTIRQLFHALVPFLSCGLVEFAVAYGMRKIKLQPVLLIVLQIAAGGCAYLLCCLLYLILFRNGASRIRDLFRRRGWAKYLQGRR